MSNGEQELIEMGCTRYGIGALTAELNKLAGIERNKGLFNGALNATACKLGSLVPEHLAEKAIVDNLMHLCWANGYCNDHKPDYVRGVILSGMKKGTSSPRPTATKGDQKPNTVLNMRRASDIQPESIRWLWPGVLAQGSISLLAGNPGLGKSQASLSIASIISRGDYWPGTRVKAQPGNVIILSMEDRAEDTIVPRLKACGADLDRILIVSTVGDEHGERQFSLERDLAKLKEAIDGLGSVGLIIIDPITAYLEKTDANSSGEVRRITSELATMAQRYDLCVLMVSHLNKKADQLAINRVLGAGAWVAAARTAWLIDKDAEDGERRTFAPFKNNLALDNSAFGFKIETKNLPGNIVTSYVVWDDNSHENTADGVLIERGNGGALTEAKQVLAELLKNGPVLSTLANKAANDNQITDSTWKRAKRSLGVEALTQDQGATWFIDYKQKTKAA